MYKLKRWLKNYNLIFKDALTWIAILWMIVEAGNHFSDGKIEEFKNLYTFATALTILFVIAIFKNKPKTTFSYKLRDIDSYLEVKVGDIFDNIGSVVVPINNNLDATLGGNVKKAKSVQNAFISKFYNEDDELLQKVIDEKINRNNSSKFDIGTVIEIFPNDKKTYLLVNSKKRPNNRVEANIDDFLLSLSKLWDYISDESDRDDTVTIPLIGTRHGRSQNLNRTKAIKEIIYSYIQNSKYRPICDKLIISILPDDVKKGNLDLDEIDEYLKFSCKHFRVVHLSQDIQGTGILGSITTSIDN